MKPSAVLMGLVALGLSYLGGNALAHAVADQQIRHVVWEAPILAVLVLLCALSMQGARK